MCGLRRALMGHTDLKHLEGHIRLNSKIFRMNSMTSKPNSKICRTNSKITRMYSMIFRVNLNVNFEPSLIFTFHQEN